MENLSQEWRMMRMYDGGKIIVGLVIGLCLLFSPYFFNAGRAAKAPQPELTPQAKKAKVCVAPTEWIKANHMHLLDTWRNSAVRDGERYYHSANGKIYYKSLQTTCLDCHSNKAKFCDQCHNYMDVQPYCWTCHFAPTPKEKSQWKSIEERFLK